VRYIPALVVQILAGVLFCNAGEKLRMPDGLSLYPQTMAIQAFLSIHTNAVSRTNLLVISEFYRDDCIDCNVLEYFVTGDGQVKDHRRDADGSLNAPRHRHISESSLKALDFALVALPTHSYTRSSNLEPEPKALRQVFDIIGERPEANQGGAAR
jgi:hypothetical protein